MNQLPQLKPAPPPAASNSKSETARLDPHFTAHLSANCEALRNDLEQAQELAADFQRDLSGKSNEVAHFKQLLELTEHDLGRLQADILELRAERHRLANEVMMKDALELRLEKVTGERNRLAAELDSLRQALASGGAENAQRVRERERQTTIQNLQMRVLQQQLQAVRTAPGLAQRLATRDPRLRAELDALAATVQELQTLMDKAAPAPAVEIPQVAPIDFGRDEFVDVKFGK